MTKLLYFLIGFWLGIVVFLAVTHVVGYKQHRYSRLFAVMTLDSRVNVVQAFYTLLGCVFGILAVVLIILFGYDETLKYF